MTTNTLLSGLNDTTLESIGHNDSTRQQLIAAAYRMLATLETPLEQMWKFTTTSNVSGVLQTLIDIGLWESWPAANSAQDDHATLDQLSSLCKKPCDPNLLRRLLRLMSAAHIIEEAGTDTYRATATSRALADPLGPIAQTFIAGGAPFARSALNLPGFLAKTGYEEPRDLRKTSFMETNPENLGLFASLKADPTLQRAFMGCMVGLTQRREKWTRVYDPQCLLQGFRVENGPLLVDVGGGHGNDVSAMLEYLDKEVAPGFLVLQDLPEVVSIAKVSAKVTVVPYDFFTPQPIKGARGYFMKSVLHDWNDENALRILKHTSEAMDKGYSKLLLSDTVIPTTGADLDASSADITLMHAHSAKERTEKDWAKLLDQAGLTVMKIWGNRAKAHCVIEAELA